MVKKIGIDAGGSLIKIVYEEKDKLHVKTYSNQEMDQLLLWLNLISPDATLHVTGGKSGYLKNTVKQLTHQVDEFEAISVGTRYLLQQASGISQDEFILVSIGTGTSIFHITPNSHERLLGSGIGGGTLMGLGSLISGETSFQKLIELAIKGNHENSDFLVRDIYALDEAPLLGDLTAANFGKAHVNKDAVVSDYMASLIQMIGETLISLAAQTAAANDIRQIVFVGSTLNSNLPLKNVLGRFQEVIPYEPVFLDKGSYAGAIGALLK